MIRAALIVTLVLGAPALLAGCDQLDALVQRGARPDVPLGFRTQMTLDADRLGMTIAVEHRGAGVAEVREAVRFEATRHCLVATGSSAAVWERDPATGDWAFAVAPERMVFRARCTGGG